MEGAPEAAPPPEVHDTSLNLCYWVRWMKELHSQRSVTCCHHLTSEQSFIPQSNTRCKTPWMELVPCTIRKKELTNNLFILFHTDTKERLLCVDGCDKPPIFNTQGWETHTNISDCLSHSVTLSPVPFPSLSAEVSTRVRERGPRQPHDLGISWTPGTELSGWDCIGSCWIFPSRVYKINACIGGLGVLRHWGKRGHVQLQVCTLEGTPAGGSPAISLNSNCCFLNHIFNDQQLVKKAMGSQKSTSWHYDFIIHLSQITLNNRPYCGIYCTFTANPVSKLHLLTHYIHYVVTHVLNVMYWLKT